MQQSDTKLSVYRPALRWIIYTIAFNIICLGFLVGLTWAGFFTPNELIVRIVVIIGDILVLGFAILHNYFYAPVIGKVRLVLSPGGALYYGPGYDLYAPWTHFERVDTAFYGTYPVEGLHFRRVPTKDKEQMLEDGQRMASMVVNPWLRWGERLLTTAEAIAPHRISDAIRLSDYAQSIPMSAFAPRNWRDSKLADEIRQYVPDVFEKKPGPLSSEEQYKRRQQRKLENEQRREAQSQSTRSKR